MFVSAVDVKNILLPKFYTPNISNIKNVNVGQSYGDIVTFGSAQYSDNSDSLDLTPAKSISGIHCPSCGAAMLSEQDYNDLVERAGKVETVVEFVDLLKEYEKYIPKPMKLILSNTDNMDSYKDLSVYQYYNQHWFEAMNAKRTKLFEVKNYLTDLADLYAQKQKDIILQTASNIDYKSSYRDYKNNIFNMLNELNLPDDVTRKIRHKLLSDVAERCVYFTKLYLKNPSELPPGVIAQSVVSQIFSDSVSGITKIEKYEDFVDDPNNDVLCCSACRNIATSGVFWRNVYNPRLKSNITRYLGDISTLMGKGELEPVHSYLNRFCFVSNVLSRGKLNFSEEDYLRFLNIRWMSSRHDNFEPISQIKVDIPCAECGSVMLPHALRHDIIDDLYYCVTPYDYAQVLKKYNKYVGSYGKQFEEIFLDIIKKYPDIPKEEFLKMFRKRVGNACYSSVNRALSKFYSQREYCEKYRTKEDLELFDRIYNRVKKYIFSGKFDDFNIVNLYSTCFSDIDFRDVSFNKSLCILGDDLRRISYRYSLIKFFENRDLNDKDEIYSIIFNLFKSNVATADHLVAASNGGENTKENLIGLCKGCNNLKNKKSVASWYTQNRLVRYNLINQLKVIDEMAKSGELPEYENWARDVARRIYSLTYGKFDLRANFEDLDNS